MFIHVNHQILFYEKKGSGPPFILVHGNGESHEIFHLLSSQLQKDYTVYAIDSRGHGQSSKTESYHYMDMTHDIVAFIEALHLNHVFYFGFSDGGIIGLLLAIHYPSLLKCLMIAGPNTHPTALKPHFYFSIWLRQKIKPNPFLQLMLHEPHITAKNLRQITTPTLLLGGEKDIIRFADFKKIQSNIKNCTLKILKRETHESYIVNSPKLYPELNHFLNESNHSFLDLDYDTKYEYPFS